VYKSVDGGETWRAAGLLGQQILTLAVDPTTPTTLYAGVQEGGVQRSDDCGETWRAVGLPGRSVRALAIHPVEPAILYAGTDDRGQNALFRSVDGGATWSESVGTGYGGITAVVIDPNAPETVYATSEIGLLRSTDGGATWSRNLIALTRVSVCGAQIPAPGHRPGATADHLCRNAHQRRVAAGNR
jgi:hypothetical protein